MKISEVYFCSLKNSISVSPLNKITWLLNQCGLPSMFRREELIAVKVHFGELGNTAFLRPVFLRPVIDLLKSMKTKPFLTDTNTLYAGMRTNSVDHLHNAHLNGFNYSTLQTPVIIADGLRGENNADVKVGLPLSEYVNLATDILHADGMVCVSHFKAHELTGIGGAIKNLGMGCASRKGKMDMHCKARPFVKEKKCTGCKRCSEACQVKAIDLRPTAFITEKCTGCVHCIAVCPENAISIPWDETSGNIQKKIVEYAYGVTRSLHSRIIFLNIITSVSPACDCYCGNDAPLVNDIGYLASTDPVALDRASYDLVIQAAGYDPFRKVYPQVNPEIQFRYAEEIKLGSVKYKLIKNEE